MYIKCWTAENVGNEIISLNKIKKIPRKIPIRIESYWKFCSCLTIVEMKTENFMFTSVITFSHLSTS